jgi:hypothetical protein
MGLGVISANVSTKVSAAVDASSSSSTTLYTCPANSYAILNLFVEYSSGTVIVTVAGNRVLLNTTTADLNTVKTIYVGPAQAVACTITSTATVYINGVEFINSP